MKYREEVSNIHACIMSAEYPNYFACVLCCVVLCCVVWCGGGCRCMEGERVGGNGGVEGFGFGD